MSTKTLGPFTGRQLTTIIVAVIVAVAVPTAAYGLTVGHTVVTDSTTHAFASVTPTGSLQVAAAAPSAFVQNGPSSLNTTFYVPVAVAPTGLALIVTVIHVDTFADPTPGSGQYAEFLITAAANCTGGQVGSYTQLVNPGAVGEIDVPLSPGVPVPTGGTLCGLVSGAVRADVSVSGYTVPAASVPAAAIRAMPAFAQQH